MGTQLPCPQKDAQPPIFVPCLLWPNGRLSRLLVVLLCFIVFNVFCAFSVIIKVLAIILLPCGFFYLLLLCQHCVVCVTVFYRSFSLFLFAAFAGDYLILLLGTCQSFVSWTCYFVLLLIWCLKRKWDLVEWKCSPGWRLFVRVFRWSGDSCGTCHYAPCWFREPWRFSCWCSFGKFLLWLPCVADADIIFWLVLFSVRRDGNQVQ